MIYNLHFNRRPWSPAEQNMVWFFFQLSFTFTAEYVIDAEP